MLFVDVNEPKDIIGTLQKKKLNIKVQKLDSADYCIGSKVGIERKSLSGDFWSSLSSGRIGQQPRLWKQLKVLVEVYERPVLLVEGLLKRPMFVSRRRYSKTFSEGDIYKRIIGALGALTTGGKWTKLNVMQTFSMDETCDYLERVYHHHLDPSNNSPPPIVMKSSDPEEIKKIILQCIRGVGPKTADKILKKYPYLSMLRSADERDLVKIPLVGKKIIKVLKEVFK